MTLPADSALTNAHTPAFGLEPGPITEVHAFWLAGMSCDGCSIAAVGAQHPSVEQLVSGAIPGIQVVILHHPRPPAKRRLEMVGGVGIEPTTSRV